MNWQDLKNSLGIGLILELEVKEINIQEKTILFNIHDFSGILTLNNISNNRELSEKLYSIISLGESISLVVIGFNDKEQMVNFSTKEFRNSLDDILPFKRCKSIIEQTHDNRFKNLYTLENRNILDRLRGDLSSNELTFLYELIQNAVDHPNPNFSNKVQITFEVFNNYLLLKHNGSLFTENNFNSINGILYGEQDQDNEINRIGYKGIGFKSVFRYTNNAYIRSGNFSFVYNREVSGAKMPWEVLPMFQFEKDKIDEIPQFDFFNVPVAFAFELRDENSKKEVIKYLKQLSQNPYLLIFLENMVKLEIKLPNESISISKEKEELKNYDLITLVSNGVKSKWVAISRKFELQNQEVIDELIDESKTAVPSKMRSFRNPKVSIAYPIDKKDALINLFTYLPLSNSNYNLPYIINADFIPDLDRTDIIHNLKYNSEILKFASDTLLDFSQLLISDKKYKYFLDIIPDFSKSGIQSLRIIGENYINNSNRLKLPDIKNRLISKEKSVVDKTGIFSIINESYINEIEGFKNSSIVSYELIDSDEKLIDYLGIARFEETDLEEIFKLNSFKNVYFSSYNNLIGFLFSIRHLKSAKKIYTILRTKVQPVLVENEYFFLNQLTIDIPDDWKNTFKFINLYRPIPSELEKKAVKHSNLRALLSNLSLNEFNQNEAVKAIADSVSSINDSLLAMVDELKSETTLIKEELENLWYFLFKNKELKDVNNNNLINNRFSALIIECTNGELCPLKDSLLMKIDNTREDYSFLYDKYGNKDLNLLNLDVYNLRYKIKNKDFELFLKQIADVEFKQSRLFRETLKQLSDEKYSRVQESEESDVIKTLIAIYQYFKKNENFDLSKINIDSLPIISKSEQKCKASDLYFDSSYSTYSGEIEIYADQLFKDIGEINFISSKYIEHIDKKLRKEFFNFLLKLNISTGIKIKHFNTEKALLIRDLPSSNLKLTVKDDFYLIHKFSLLIGKYENLKVFWSNLNKEEKFLLLAKKLETGLIYPNYSVSPLLIYLNDNECSFFPLQNGTCVGINSVYSKELSSYVSNKDTSLTFNLLEYEELLPDLELSQNLLNEDLIFALSQNENWSDSEYDFLIISQLVEANLNEEEINNIKKKVKFKCNDNNYRLLKDTVYIDKSLENTTLNIFSESNDIYIKSIKSYDFDPDLKRKLIELDLIIISENNIICSFDIDIESEMDLAEELKNLLLNFYKNNTIPFDLESFNEYFDTITFNHCKNITLSFDNYSDFEEPVLFYIDGDKDSVYFIDIITLLDLVCEKFEINNSEKYKIRTILNKNLYSKKNTSEEENTEEDNNDEENENYETDYFKEVKSFIESMKELEDIYDDDKIEELKSILADFRDQPDDKRKAYNMLAKLKLCKKLELNFAPEWEFNKVNNEQHKYFIHSARGSFAYIHPNELIQMRDHEYKMAIDFGTKDIRIYDSHTEIIELYKNFLMLYQDNPSEEDILGICEENQYKEKFHFLIVDRERQTEDAMSIFNILNKDSYE